MWHACLECVGTNCEQILAISIYRESNTGPAVPFGKRATMFSGRAPLGEIFREEVSGPRVEKPQVHVDQDGKNSMTEELESGTAVAKGRRGNMLVMGRTFTPPRSSSG
jgi:hypothetical protein